MATRLPATAAAATGQRGGGGRTGGRFARGGRGGGGARDRGGPARRRDDDGSYRPSPRATPPPPPPHERVVYHDADEYGDHRARGGGGRAGRAPSPASVEERVDIRHKTRASRPYSNTSAGACDDMADAILNIELAMPRCPMCAQAFAAKSTRARHLSLCCPDLIDPDGWRAGDGAVVRDAARLRHPPRSFRWEVLSRRFGWVAADDDVDLEDARANPFSGAAAAARDDDDDPSDEYFDVEASNYAAAVAREVSDHNANVDIVASSNPNGVGGKGRGRGGNGGGGGAPRAPMTARAVAKSLNGAFYLTLVPIRPRPRGERRSLRTFAVVSLRPPLAFNSRPRRLSTPTDAFQIPQSTSRRSRASSDTSSATSRCDRIRRR